jgi:long-chain acyl-CoA synthetase
VKPDHQLTLADLPFRLLERFDRSLLMGRCEEQGFREMSTAALVDRIRAFSLGLSSLGLRPGDRVALVSESRPEWVICDLAVLTAGAVTVPVYPTLSAPQLWYILAESGARFAIVSSEAQVRKLGEVTRGLTDLEAVIVIDGTAAGEGFRILRFDEVSATGADVMARDPQAAARHEAFARAIEPGCVATIVYTSGTTGDPKGVMLTHRNIISNVIGTLDVFLMDASDTIVSFLPLSHVFERVVVYRCLFDGVTIYFAEALTTVARDLERVRPTVMTGVPRVYEKIFNALQDGIAKLPAPRRALARWGVAAGYERARAWLAGRPISGWLKVKHALADRLVLSKMRARMGGRIRFLVSGSAPLSAKVAEFFYAIGLPVIEGYGLTESSPCITANPPAAPRLGSVGKPLVGVEVRLGPDGEVLARGPNIMQGYYKRPDDTARALEDGWLHTGDIGQIDTDGYLTITDRKKDLIVTSGGKKIAPQPLENQLKAEPLVAEAVLVGERRKFPAALIVPDFARLEAWARERGLAFAGRDQLLALPDVVSRYQTVLDALNGTLAQFERIKRFALLPTEFTMERGELTPTMKVRRAVVEERWKGVIDELYASRPGN